MADQLRHADAAESLLDESSNGGLTREHREFCVLRGIGYALLAIDERLGTLAEAADDRNAKLEQIREAVGILHQEPRRTLRQWLSGLAWRWWGARGAERAWRRRRDGAAAGRVAVMSAPRTLLAVSAVLVVACYAVVLVSGTAHPLRATAAAAAGLVLIVVFVAAWRRSFRSGRRS